MSCDCFQRLIRESLAADVSYYNRHDNQLNSADITFFVLRLVNRISRFKPRNVRHLVDCVNQAVAYVKWFQGEKMSAPPSSEHSCAEFSVIINQCVNADLSVVIDNPTDSSSSSVPPDQCLFLLSLLSDSSSDYVPANNSQDPNAGSSLLDNELIEWSLQNTGPTHPAEDENSESHNITAVVGHRYIQSGGGGLVFTVQWEGYLGYDEQDVSSVIRAARPLSEYLWTLSDRCRLDMLQKYPQLEDILPYQR